MSRIRIKDIARMAEVSPGTVDRVIHNRSGVSQYTRERVQQLIQEFDYRPDILAGRLASGKKTRILVCMPRIVFEHEFWEIPDIGVQKALFELEHFDVEVEYLRFDQHSKSDFKKKLNGVDPVGYDGVMFVPVFPEEAKQFIASCEGAMVPCIQFNTRISDTGGPAFIGQDAFQSGLLGGKLMSFGLAAQRDLLVLNLSMHTDHYQHIVRRELGFRSYFESHPERVRNLVSVNISEANPEKVADALDEKLDKYDVAGIFVTNSRVHMVARYMAEHGVMGTRLIGYDLLAKSVEYLKREYIDFLISQSPEEQAYLGIRYLTEYSVLKREIPPEVLIPIDIITRENVEHYLQFRQRDYPDL